MRYAALLLAILPATLCQLVPESQSRPSVRGFSTIAGICEAATAIQQFSGRQGTLKSCKTACEEDPSCQGLNLVTDEAQCVLLAQACENTIPVGAAQPTQNFYLKGEIACSTSTVGKEFVVAFMSNRVAKPVNMSLELWVTQDTEIGGSTVQMVSHPSAGISRQVDVPYKQAVKTTIPHTWKMTDVDAGVQIERKALTLTSDVDFVLYGVNKEFFTADAFLGIPTRALGTRYVANCMWPPFYNCEFAFTPAEDGTTITVTLPRGATRNTGNWAKPPTEESRCNLPFQGRTLTNGDSFTVTLNKFEVAQVQDPCDLTGAIIQSDKPIALWSGDSRVNIGDAPSRDHQVEELFSTDTWGYDCAAWPTPNRAEGLTDYWVLTADEDNTVIRVMSSELGERSFSLNAGESVRFPANSVREWQHFKSDKKFVAVQYAHSAVDNSIPGDPAMTTCIPTEQFGFGYTFVTPTGVATTYTNFLTIITKSGAENGFILDGQPVTDVRWNPIPGSDLVGGYVMLDSSRQQFRIEHLIKGTTFEAYIYGSGDRESIAYPTGACIKALGECFPSTMFIADGKDNDCDGVIDEELCDGVDNDFDGQVDEDCYDRQKLPEDRCPEVKNAESCYGGNVQLSCESGNIKVLSAFFGRSGHEGELSCGFADQHSCGGGSLDCGVSDVSKYFASRCNGQQSCSEPVDLSPPRDIYHMSPCPTCALYTRVQYTCLNAREQEHSEMTGSKYTASSYLAAGPTADDHGSSKGKCDSTVGTSQSPHHPSAASFTSTSTYGWRPSMYAGGKSWLQVDLGAHYSVGYYAIQGCGKTDHWVTKFGISYSQNGNDWTDVKEPNGAWKMFEANSDASTIRVCTIFAQNIQARYIRVIPLSYNGAACLKVDFGHAKDHQSCKRSGVVNSNFEMDNAAAYGSEAVVRCDEGWATDRGETSYRVSCGSDGNWQGNFQDCSQLQTCGDIPFVDGGYSMAKNNRVGSHVYFVCQSGRRLVGASEIQCGANGQWSGAAPYCEQL